MEHVCIEQLPEHTLYFKWLEHFLFSDAEISQCNSFSQFHQVLISAKLYWRHKPNKTVEILSLENIEDNSDG